MTTTNCITPHCKNQIEKREINIDIEMIEYLDTSPFQINDLRCKMSENIS